MSNLELDDKIEYQDTGRHSRLRTGYIIAFNKDCTRARIKWTDNRPRTWIRVQALRKITETPPSDEQSSTLIYGCGVDGKIPTKKH